MSDEIPNLDDSSVEEVERLLGSFSPKQSALNEPLMYRKLCEQLLAERLKNRRQLRFWRNTSLTTICLIVVGIFPFIQMIVPTERIEPNEGPVIQTVQQSKEKNNAAIQITLNADQVKKWLDDSGMQTKSTSTSNSEDQTKPVNQLSHSNYHRVKTLLDWNMDSHFEDSSYQQQKLNESIGPFIPASKQKQLTVRSLMEDLID